MAQSIMFWNPAVDDTTLRQVTAKDARIKEKLPIYLAVYRFNGTLHWSIVWHAYAPETTALLASTEHIGFKIMEVRNPSTNPREFKYRFSFKPRDSHTAKQWKLRVLASLTGAERESLAEVGKRWSPKVAIGGNCITCVCDLVKFLTEPIGDRPGPFPSTALEVMNEAREEDMSEGREYRDTHLIATTGNSGMDFQC